MTTTARPNFFILLDLNPDAPWSDAVFESVLNMKRGVWSKDSTIGVGVRGLQAGQNLRLIPEINRVMRDVPSREAEAAAARIERGGQQKQRSEAFENQLAFLNAKGTITQAELDKFINDFKDIFTEQQIKDRVTATIDKAIPLPLAPTLDPNIAKNIADRLAILSLSSLYELLGGPGTDQQSIVELSRLADALSTKMVRIARNEEDIAKKELAGYAKDIFKSKESKEKYDETLRRMSLTQLLAKLNDVMSRVADKILRVGQVTLFLDEAQKAGWARDVALRHLQEHARTRNWSIELPTIDHKEKIIKCGKCSHLNKQGERACTACGELLYVKCPKCGKENSCENNACGHCGFPIGNRYRVDTLLAEIDLLYRQDRFTEADEKIVEAERAWNTGKTDERSQKLTLFRKQIDAARKQREQKQKEVSEQCMRLVGQKHFYAVQSLLNSTTGVMFPARETSRRVAEAAIAQAQKLYKQAMVAPTIDAKIELCRQALLLCADYQDARDLLKVTPPAAPAHLRSRIKGIIINLAWDPAGTPGVKYHIVRKARTQPNDIQDGDTLNAIVGISYDDTTAPIGLPLYYAIYTECEGVFSLQGALLPHSLLITQDVQNLLARGGHQQVELYWQVPPQAVKMRLLRKKEKPSTSPTDGDLLAALDAEQTYFLDQGLENGLMYYYALYAQFRDQDGRLVTSYGAHVMATPEAPPRVETEFHFQEAPHTQGMELEISWEGPPKGTIVVLKSEQKPTLHFGSSLAEADLGRHGQRLNGQNETLKDIWNHSGIVYYIPILLLQKWAYVGSIHRYAWVESIRNLQHQNVGSAIRLQWIWPETCSEVIVSFSPQGWPRPNDAYTTTKHVSQSLYDQTGYYDITGIANQIYYITLVPIIKQKSESIQAKEIRLKERIVSKMVFKYEIKNVSTFFKKKQVVQIIFKTRGTLPALLLIAKRDHLPRHKADGDRVYRIEPMLVHEEKVLIPLPEMHFPANTFGKLFLEDDDDVEAAIIHQPEMQKLRLS